MDKFIDMTHEQRAEVRARRKQEQAERDARAIQHAKDHPVSEQEKAHLRRLMRG